MQKKGYIVDYIFRVLIIIVLVLGFFPFSNEIHFYPKGSGEIISLSCKTDNGTVTNKDSLKVDRSIHKDSGLTLVTTDDYYANFTYAGIPTGTLTGNAQDGEYLSRITLDAFESGEEKKFPKNTYFKDDLTLTEFINEYKDKDYAFFFVVKGDSTIGFSTEMRDSLLSLNIQTTPLSLKSGDSYIAYSYKDESYVEADRDSLVNTFNINDHIVSLTSCGYYHGNYASVLVDGIECADQGNGLNIVVYDLEEDKVIDSVSYNTNTNNPVMERADDVFYTEYTVTFTDDLFVQLEAYNAVTKIFIHISAIVVSIILYILLRNIRKIRKIDETGKMPQKKWYIHQNISLYLIWILFAILLVAEEYVLSSFSGITIDQLVFHMNTNLEGSNWSTFLPTLIQAGLYILIAVIGCTIVTFIQKYFIKKANRYRKFNLKAKEIIKEYSLHFITTLCGFIAICIVLVSLADNYYLIDYLAARRIDTEIYDKYYIDTATVELTFPEKKKNLVYIYMESMEMSLADESHGGGKSVNVIPELTDIALENDCFNGDTDILNGARSLYNSTWTIAGLVAQTSGLPLGINHVLTNNINSISSFMPGATTLGDILEKEGYHNVFMLGSDAKFGNRDVYFKEHGNYDIDDYYWARNNNKLPDKSYYVWWGYEDDKLFTYAKEELTSLAESDEPFALSLLTVDTHFVNGYLCDDCPDRFTSQYSNVLACSSKKVSELVEWIEAQPWGEDTVIVLNGDHLCMDSKYYEDMPEDYERKTYTAIINSSKKEPDTTRLYSTMDLFPTTLSAMGVTIKGDRLGLGTDLYSDTPTLLEELGENYLNYELSLNSTFYDKNILE